MEPPRNEFGPCLPGNRPPWLAEALGVGPRDRVLEVGGGGNAWSRADAVCDLSFASSAQRNGAPAVLREGVRYVEAPVESLPFDDGEFDFVYCTQVLEHVADPAQAAAELSRVARRGYVEVPSRLGEMVFGNPTHRWIVDREGKELVFHPRPFVEHPLQNAFYGPMLADPCLRTLVEDRYRNLFNHQVLFEGVLRVRVLPRDPGHFDADDPAQILRATRDFAHRTLQHGAPADYALPELLQARRLAPEDPFARALHALILARLGRPAEAQELAPPGSPIARLLPAVLRGELPAAALPVPAPAPAPAPSPRRRPRITVLALAKPGFPVLTGLASALTQDLPDVEVLLGAPAGDLRDLEGLEFGARLRRVEAEGLPALLGAAAAGGPGDLLAFLLLPDRWFAHHLELAVAHLGRPGVDAVHTDALRPGAGPAPARPLTGLSCVVLRRELLEELCREPMDAGGSGLLERVLRSGRSRRLPAATVALDARTPVLPAADHGSSLLPILGPLEIHRELVAAAEREAALRQRIRRLEEEPGRP